MTRIFIASIPAWVVLVTALCFLTSPVLAECQKAVVSWYGLETCVKGRKCQTANGTPFDGTQMVVAHRTMAFGTKLRFTYAGKSIEVPVDDRGPFVKGRAFDLSQAAFAKLADPDRGVIRACWEMVP